MSDSDLGFFIYLLVGTVSVLVLGLLVAALRAGPRIPNYDPKNYPERDE